MITVGPRDPAATVASKAMNNNATTTETTEVAEMTTGKEVVVEVVVVVTTAALLLDATMTVVGRHPDTTEDAEEVVFGAAAGTEAEVDTRTAFWSCSFPNCLLSNASTP